MSRKLILAIDQSTSATKAILFDAEARPVHRVTIDHRQYYPSAGLVEHDPVEILDNTRAAAARAIAEAGRPGDRIEALAITNQRETVLAWDLESGRPVGRAIVWQDERGTRACDAMRAAGVEPEIQARTGLLLDTYFSASKVKWLLENSDDAARLADQRRLAVGTIDAWLVWNLTDRAIFATDHTNASRTLLFNVHTLEWDPKLLDAFGLMNGDTPRVVLPEVRPTSSRFGATRIEGLDYEVPIIGVCGDSHAALFGQGAFDAGECKTTFGTGSSLMLNVGRVPLEPPLGVVLSIGWAAGAEVTYVFEGNIHSTGDTVKWVRDNLRLFESYDDAERRAAALDDNGGVYLVPAFGGLGAPHWVHGVRATLSGMSRGSGADHIIRAALESIGYQVDDLLSRMKENTAITMRDLRVDGGPTGNRFLMQFLADTIDSPVRVASAEEISARGVAFFAGLEIGLYRGYDHLRELSGFARSYEPRIDADERERRRSGWGRALSRVLADADQG